MGETKKVLTELKNGVLIVTINREERRNAIDPETSAMMEQILNDAEQNPEVGAIIITGTGDRSFCSGEDLAAYDENGTCQTIMAHGFAGITERLSAKPIICAANGTDNQSLVKDIMLQMTTNDDVMKDIIEKDDDFVNNQDVIAEMADSSYSSKILGGQNPLGIYSAGVSKLDLSNLSAYDQGCNEEFQNAMKNYFEGTATKEEALDLFYKAVVEKYPELTY